MAGRKQNPIKDITDTVSAWLGGNRGTINPQVQRTISQTKRAAKTIDQFVTGGLGAAAVADAQRMAATGSSTPSALYKTAAVNLGAAAAGVGAAKVAGKVVEAGVVARAVNKLTGKKVVVHASPVIGLKTIEPRLGSNQLPEQNVVFGWDPKKKGMEIQITRSAGRYVAKESGQTAGSVYLAQMRKSDIVTPARLSSSGQVVSRSSAKVVREIPVAGKTYAQVDAELRRALKRAGAAVPSESRVAAAARKTAKTVRQLGMTEAQKQAARRRSIR